MAGGTFGAFGFVTFQTQEQGTWIVSSACYRADPVGLAPASRAMSAMNGTLIGGSVLQVRFHEPSQQRMRIFRIPSVARTNVKDENQSAAKDANVRVQPAFMLLIED